MVTLSLTVACACAPDESGKHPIKLGITTSMNERPIVRSIGSPCVYKEADAIDRLGVPTCVSVIDALRRGLSGKSMFSLARSDVTDETERLWELTKSKAAKVRDARRVEALQRHDGRMVNTLLTARLSRLWPAEVTELTDVAAVHFGLSNPPQVRLFFGRPINQSKMAIFVFEKTRREGWRWRLREGARPIDVPTLVPILEQALDKILPESAMRGAGILAKKERVQLC